MITVCKIVTIAVLGGVAYLGFGAASLPAQSSSSNQSAPPPASATSTPKRRPLTPIRPHITPCGLEDLCPIRWTPSNLQTPKRKIFTRSQLRKSQCSINSHAIAGATRKLATKAFWIATWMIMLHIAYSARKKPPSPIPRPRQEKPRRKSVKKSWMANGRTWICRSTTRFCLLNSQSRGVKSIGSSVRGARGALPASLAV